MLNTTTRCVILGSLISMGGTGCVMVPVASDGTPIYPGSVAAAYPAIPVPAVQGPGPNALAPVPPPRNDRRAPGPSAANVPPPNAELAALAGSGSGSAPPASLQARLYPANDIATETGLLSGTVTNMMTGRGIFQLNYRSDTLVGEATRVPGDDRRGVAHAYGQHGTYMTCDYRMTTPYMGTGTCSLSNGAQYQVHIGG
jgi:hypothetical protein